MKLIKQWRAVSRRAHSMRIAYAILVINVVYTGVSAWTYGAMAWLALINAGLVAVLGIARLIDQGGVDDKAS